MKPARAIEESLIDRLARPFQIFAAHKLSGAVLLLATLIGSVLLLLMARHIPESA